jgi:tetratricopeptide (TPR) repeat protein
MRFRSSLFAVLVACGSGAEPAQVVSQPAPVVAARTVEAPPVRSAMVQLPQLAVSELPLDQTPAPWTLTASDGSGLVATKVEAKAVMQGPLAFTELHLYFTNVENRIREGTFAITLPAGAAVSRFAMETNGQWMEAEVVEKQVARRAYEDFLHRKQDPALMEKAPGNQFTARVFPIEANSVKHVIVSFSQELPGTRYVLPLRGLPKVKQLEIELHTPAGDQKLTKQEWLPDADFVSTAETSAEAITAGGIVVAQVSPFDQATVRPQVPKAITLLVDTSASRALGFNRYAATIRELVQALATRYSGVVVDVLAFDQDTQSIYSGPASGFGRAQVELLEKRGAAGASDLEQALAKVTQPRERIVVVTDGVLTAGASGSDLTAKLAGLKTDRVDVVMTGGIRDQALATSLVTALPRTGAVLDLDQRLGEVADGIGQSVLSQLSVEVAGASWVWPRTISSARPGQRTMIYAKFDKPVTTLDVRVGDRRQTLQATPGTDVLIARATAAAEVADLDARLPGTKGEEAKALKKELVHKAIAARVISSQTSMLVLESNEDYGRFGIDRKSLADVLVVGPKGLELRNRSFVAVKRPPPPRRVTGGDNFALKDTTDPSVAMAAREKSERMQGIAMGSSGGVQGGVVGGELAPAPRTAVAAKSADSAEDKPKAEPVQAAESQAERQRSRQELERLQRERSELLTRREQLGNQNNPLARDRSNGEQFPPPDAPPPLKGKLAEIDRLIRRNKTDDALAKAIEWHAKAPGDVLALIGLGEALEAKKDLTQAARIYGSIIDLFPGRADLRRFAGERLERVGDHARWLAVDTYRRAALERPDHMTGHRLLAYALLRDGKHAEALAAIVKGLKQRYPEGRFEGGLRVLAEDAGLIGAAYLASAPDKKQEIEATLRKAGASLARSSSTRFIMYWETDANDVDFHIQDAQGGHAYFSAPSLPSGGELYADITTGYGPECFTIPGRPSAGPYKLSINYYSQGPMGYGMGLLQIIKHDGKGKLEFQDRPYVIMNSEAYVNLGTFR